MKSSPVRVHCELGPILVNRTAVFKMCRDTPGELQRRGLDVTCSALLSRVRPDNVEPANPWQQRLFDWSRRWLVWAIEDPGFFDKTRQLTKLVPHWMSAGRNVLFLDPLYSLFYGAPDNAVVIVYDITPVSDPEWHHPHVGRLYGFALDMLARSRCHIVASCQNTADQLRVSWGIAPSRLSVLPLGLFSFPKPPAVAGHADEPPFFLFVGATQEMRKNVIGLIRAFERSGLHRERGIRLRIIGSHADEQHPVVALAKSTPGVDLLGFVNDAELAAAYENCLAFVYPSFAEGFGLPLLEAMHRGCVCLSTITGASPEVGGDAVLYVNPYDTAAIAEQLRRIAVLTPDRRRIIATAGMERSQLFTWSRFYDGLADILITTSNSRDFHGHAHGFRAVA